MRFRVEQRFAAGEADVAQAYASPELFAALPATAKLARPELVHHERDGDQVIVEVRYRFQGDLSSAVKAVLDPARLTWVERTVHDLATHTATFELRPDHYPERLRSRGTVRVLTGSGGTERLIEGDLKVRAPLVAGTVERTLISDLRSHLASEAAAVDSFLATL